MHQDTPKDRIEGDKIIIYDNSGYQFKILKHIVFISEDGIKKYRIQKSKNRKYSMQK